MCNTLMSDLASVQCRDHTVCEETASANPAHTLSEVQWSTAALNQHHNSSGRPCLTTMTSSLTSIARFANWCAATYGVRPSVSAADVAYGGRDVRASGSRIVFTNGELDPWSAAGVTEDDVDAARDLVSIRMRGAAHHLDLRSPNAADPADVVAARNLQRRMLRKWISEDARVRCARV